MILKVYSSLPRSSSIYEFESKNLLKHFYNPCVLFIADHFVVLRNRALLSCFSENKGNDQA